MPVVLSATSSGFWGGGGRLRKASRIAVMASWQMVGSSKVGFRGLGEKFGGRPMPEIIRGTVVFVLPLLAGGERVLETLPASRMSPSMMVRWVSMADWGIPRSSSRVWSLEVERLTG